MKIPSIIAAGLFAAGCGVSADATAQTTAPSAPAPSIENRQARGQPDAVAKKRGTRCRIVKRAGQDKRVCSKAPVRR